MASSVTEILDALAATLHLAVELSPCAEDCDSEGCPHRQARAALALMPGLRERISELGVREYAMRRRVHIIDGHNQFFERCESAWCNPGKTNDPAKEGFGAALKTPADYEAALAAAEATAAKLKKENETLRMARRNQRGDDLCWIGTDDPTAKALPEPEFLESCRRFRNQWAAEHGEVVGCMTIAQLEEEIEAGRFKARILDRYTDVCLKHNEDITRAETAEADAAFWRAEHDRINGMYFDRWQELKSVEATAAERESRIAELETREAMLHGHLQAATSDLAAKEHAEERVEVLEAALLKIGQIERDYPGDYVWFVQQLARAALATPASDEANWPHVSAVRKEPSLEQRVESICMESPLDFCADCGLKIQNHEAHGTVAEPCAVRSAQRPAPVEARCMAREWFGSRQATNSSNDFVRCSWQGTVADIHGPCPQCGERKLVAVGGKDGE